MLTSVACVVQQDYIKAQLQEASERHFQCSIQKSTLSNGCDKWTQPAFTQTLESLVSGIEPYFDEECTSNLGFCIDSYQLRTSEANSKVLLTKINCSVTSTTSNKTF